MDDDVTVVRDEIEAYADGTVARVRVLAVPESEKFDDGIKYSLHYGESGADAPIIRFDNHHGVHELHIGATTFEIEFPGGGAAVPCLARGAPGRETRRLVAAIHVATIAIHSLTHYDPHAPRPDRQHARSQ